MQPYGQYCPISRSAEVLGDRWTLHIVRDLLTGNRRFNELIRGNPGLSRALLSRRLAQLIQAAVIEHRPDGTYHLTPAGHDLEPIVFGLAAWGARWTFGDPEPDELDPDLLMWWLHRRLDVRQLGSARFTIFVHLVDHAKRYWIVVEEAASICLADPGFEVDITIRSDRSTLYRTYLGHQTLRHASRSGQLEVLGKPASVRRFMNAFQPSPVAGLVAEGSMSS